jgi:CheY-like chemotaxis protein
MANVETEPAGVERKQTRVLIADDDADVCALLRVVLRPVADVTAVHDAEAALELLANDGNYDAIISDFMLPGIDGLEFVRRVRSTELNRRVPILMISGHGTAGVGEQARAEGVDAFLDKPFTLSQLRTILGALLGPAVQMAI